MSRTRTTTIPVVVTMMSDATGEHVIKSVIGQVDTMTHPVLTSHGHEVTNHNAVEVARRHVAAMILLAGAYLRGVRAGR